MQCLCCWLLLARAMRAADWGPSLYCGSGACIVGRLLQATAGTWFPHCSLCPGILPAMQPAHQARLPTPCCRASSQRALTLAVTTATATTATVAATGSATQPAGGCGAEPPLALFACLRRTLRRSIPQSLLIVFAAVSDMPAVIAAVPNVDPLLSFSRP